jgi:hypothetical protein
MFLKTIVLQYYMLGSSSLPKVLKTKTSFVSDVWRSFSPSKALKTKTLFESNNVGCEASSQRTTASAQGGDDGQT